MKYQVVIWKTIYSCWECTNQDVLDDDEFDDLTDHECLPEANAGEEMYISLHDSFEDAIRDIRELIDSTDYYFDEVSSVPHTSGNLWVFRRNEDLWFEPHQAEEYSLHINLQDRDGKLSPMLMDKAQGAEFIDACFNGLTESE